MDIEASNGDEALSIDEAAAAYVRSTAPQEVETDQADDVEQDEGDTTDDELQASDENEEAGEEDEGEPGDEDQAEDGDDEEADPESEQGRFVADNAKVRLEDGTVISVSELKKGSLLHADYTRKTQETAELRRSFEAQSESVKQAEQQIIEQRQYMTTLLQSVMPQAPDPSLVRTDPVAYMEQKAQYEQFTQHLDYLRQQDQQTQQQRQQEAQAKRQEKVNSEWGALLEKAPELKDKTKFTAFEAELVKAAPEFGFSPQELMEAVPYDHRMALVLKDAIAWRKLQASKPQAVKKTEGRPPIHKGGKRLGPQAQKARQADAAITRLKSTGSLADATAAYLARQKG
jgi:hypothetical protein